MGASGGLTLGSPEAKVGSPEWLLSGMLNQPEVRVHAISAAGDENAPDDAALTPGWIHHWHSPPHGDPDGVGYLSRGMKFTHGGSVIATGVRGERRQGLKRLASRAGSQLDPLLLNDRMAMLVEMASRGVHADVLVSTQRWPRDECGMVVLDPLEAVAAIGHYLRCQGAYLALPGLRFPEELFYWVAARGHLPSSWRWFGAAVQHADDASDDSLMAAAQSVLRRIARGLKNRDLVHLATREPSTWEAQGRCLSALDSLLVDLAGAFDAAALVAHYSLGLTGDDRRVGWQQETGWMAEVRAHSPELDAVVTANPDFAAHRVLREMRNLVHAQALEGVTVSTHGTATSQHVMVPAVRADRVDRAVHKAGGREIWGVEQVGDALTIEPSVLVEAMISRCVRVLDEVMVATPVENLVEDHERLHSEPPEADSSLDPFHPITVASIVRQVALD